MFISINGIKTHIKMLALLLHRNNMIKRTMDRNNLIILMVDSYERRLLLWDYNLFEIKTLIDGIYNFCVVVQGEHLRRGIFALD